MPNKCTVCGKVHPDDAKYLLNGCDKCGSKFFFYVRKESLKKAEDDMKKITKKDMEEIEEDIRDIIPKDVEENETVILDIEAINVLKPGKYEIDVTNLFSQKAIVIRVGAGKYEIDLSTLLGKWKEVLTSHVRTAEKAEKEEEEARKAEETSHKSEDKKAENDGEEESEEKEEEEKHLKDSDK